MNDQWHIPRASLASSGASSASSSGSRSHKSHSNPPTVAQRANAKRLAKHNHFAHDGTEWIGHHQQQQQRRSRSSSRTATATVHSSGNHININNNNNNRSKSSSRRDSELSGHSAAATAAAAAAVLAAAAAANGNAKRGSRSSQGSTDSNNSTRSAASGSLLLTAANLERFAEIHKQQQRHTKVFLEGMPNVHHQQQQQQLAIMPATAATRTTNTIYNTNLMHAVNSAAAAGHHNANYNHNHNSDAIITLDPNLNFIKTKDLDTISLASSMHFTMVNGDDNPASTKKRGLCDWGRQVTVLILSMSGVFLLLIMGMVYALEMRAREMPQS